MRRSERFHISTTLAGALGVISVAWVLVGLSPLFLGCPQIFEDTIPAPPAPIPVDPIVQVEPPTRPGETPAEAVSTGVPGTAQTPLSFAGLAGSSLRGLSAGLPTGKKDLGGVDFAFGDIFLQLRSSRRPGYPNYVRIPVDRAFDSVHFLHATQYGTPSLPIGAPPEDELSAGSFERFENMLVGEYVILYRSGAERVVPLRYGQEIRDWWNWDGRNATVATTTWEIDDERAGAHGLSARLFQLTWTNPDPDDVVDAIEFRSAETIASPFCVAITVETHEPAGASSDFAASSVPAGASASSDEQVEGALPSGYVERQSNSFRDTMESYWGGYSLTPKEKPIPAPAPAVIDDSSPEIDVWNASLERLKIDRDRALADLLEQFRSKIDDARARALLDNRNDDVAILEQDAAKLAGDPYAPPRSADVKTPAATFFDATVARENDFLVSLKALDAKRPAKLSALDRAEAAAEIAEIEASLARLALSQRMLASSSSARPGRASTAASVRPGMGSAPGEGEAEFVGPAPIRWKVVVDPPAEPASVPRRVSYKRIDSLLPEHVLYPPGSASVVQAGIGAERFDGLRLVDLSTGKTLAEIDFGGSIGPPTGLTRGAALSPAGDRWATREGSPSKEFFVVDPRTDGVNRPATTLRFGEVAPTAILPTSTRCILLDAERRTVTAHSLPQGLELAKAELFATPSTLPGRYAVSPGGRYVVVTDDSTGPTSARFLDMQTGEEVGALELSGETARPTFVAFAFSPDGKEFAAYMENVPAPGGAIPPGRGIAVWDVATGRPTYARPIEGLSVRDERSDYPLQWFPDQRGWLVLQRFVVSRELARATQRLESYSDPTFGQNGAAILNDEQVLIAGGPSGLVVQEVDRGAE